MQGQLRKTNQLLLIVVMAPRETEVLRDYCSEDLPGIQLFDPMI